MVAKKKHRKKIYRTQPCGTWIVVGNRDLEVVFYRFDGRRARKIKVK